MKLALPVLALLAACAPALAPPELTIYAAASLRDALTELTPALERASGAGVRFNFGSSGDLARQIVAALAVVSNPCMYPRPWRLMSWRAARSG